MSYRNRYCKAVEELVDNPQHVGEGVVPGPAPFVDIDLGLTRNSSNREFVFERAFGPQAIIDLNAVQWDWVFSTWNPAHTELPVPSRLFPIVPIFVGITQQRTLDGYLAYPFIPPEGAVSQVNVIHYYAPRRYDAGEATATVRFLVRNTLSATDIPRPSLRPPRDIPTPDIPGGLDISDAPDVPDEAAAYPLDTGNLIWVWNAVQVAGGFDALETAVAAIEPSVVGISGRHLGIDTSKGPVSIRAKDALPGHLGGVKFDRWDHLWPPGSPKYTTHSTASFTLGDPVVHIPQGARAELVAIYSARMVVFPESLFPALTRLFDRLAEHEFGALGVHRGGFFTSTAAQLDELAQKVASLQTLTRAARSK